MPKKKKKLRKPFSDPAKNQTRYVRIKSDVNCIPAGIYKLTGREGDVFIFEVGRRIRFGVGNIDPAIFEPLSRHEGKSLLTTETQFAERYYELLRSGPRLRLPRWNEPVTSCMMDSSLAGRYEH